MNVLLLEPDVVLGQTYAAAIAKAGHKATHCTNAQDALGALDSQCPDLIILEVQLAGHNGIEFLYELRSYADWQNVPVVVVSMVPPFELGLTTKLRQQLGIAGCYYKPHIRLSDLVDSVNKLVLAG